MRSYELIFIARPDIDETAVGEITQKASSWITDGGGQINKVDLWGKRRLAYPIRKQIEGQYVLLDFDMPTTLAATIERNLRFLDPVLRFLLIQK